DRGVRLQHTSQLNFGGNTDFYNMLERDRLVSKKISKTDAVRSQLTHELPADAVHIGPSDYVPWLADRKWAHIRLEGRGFGDQPRAPPARAERVRRPSAHARGRGRGRCAVRVVRAHHPHLRDVDPRPPPAGQALHRALR